MKSLNAICFLGNLDLTTAVHWCTGSNPNRGVPLFFFFSFLFFPLSSAGLTKGCACQSACAPPQQGLKIPSLHLPRFTPPTRMSFNVSAEARTHSLSRAHCTDDTSSPPDASASRWKTCRFPPHPPAPPPVTHGALFNKAPTDLRVSRVRGLPTCPRCLRCSPVSASNKPVEPL